MNTSNSGDSPTSSNHEETKVYNQDDLSVKSVDNSDSKSMPHVLQNSEKELDSKRQHHSMLMDDKQGSESVDKLEPIDSQMKNISEESVQKISENSNAQSNTNNPQSPYLTADGEAHAEIKSQPINRSESSEGTVSGDSLNFKETTYVTNKGRSPDKKINDIESVTNVTNIETEVFQQSQAVVNSDKSVSTESAEQIITSKGFSVSRKFTDTKSDNDTTISSDAHNIDNISDNRNDLLETNNTTTFQKVAKSDLINDVSPDGNLMVQSEMSIAHEAQNGPQNDKLDQNKTDVILSNDVDRVEKENDALSHIPLINQEIIQDVINNEIKNTKVRMSLAESINNVNPKLQNNNNIENSLLDQPEDLVPASTTEYENQIDSILNNNEDSKLELPEKINLKKRESTSDILAESHRILEKVRNLKDSNFSSTFMTLREEQAQVSALPMILVAPRTLPMEIQIGINSLPNLDNLASQVLRFFVLSSFEEIKTILEDPDSEESLALNVLVHLFTTAKSLYTRDVKNFITIEDITPGITNSLHDYEQTIVGREEIFDNTIKKTNLATFICAVTSLIDINLIELNESFMDVFTSGYLSSEFNSGISLISSITGIGMPGKLTRLLGDLFLELKTQAYIANCTTKNAGESDGSGAMQDKDRGEYDEELEYLFPNNLQEILTESAELKVSVPAEKEFVQKCASRKLYLKEMKTLNELLIKYPFIDFVKNFLKFISRNIGFTIYGKRISQGGNRLTLWNNHGQSDYGSYTTDPQALKRSQDEEAKDTYSKKKQKVFNPGTSDRRLWTTEELDCLISSIKEYGAQWTKILQIHGNGGAKTEILKNRSTTQLKDKARNIKIQFLKNDQQLPDYLQKVPGELEKSGPRARRKN